MLKVLLIPVLGMLCLFKPLPVFCQVNDTIFDVPEHYESAYTPEMVYIKWFSTGSKPAPLFIVMRYEGDKPIQVHSEKMIYLQNDTTFYVLQDTTAPAIQPPEVLQYFMAPYDTTGVAGISSDMVMVSADEIGVAWFKETRASRLEKENGVLLEWQYSQSPSVLLFEIYRSEDLNRGYHLIASVPGRETSFSDQETRPDVVYYYQIQAILKSGNRSILSNVIFSASYNPQAPAAPYIEYAFPLPGGAEIHIQATDPEALGVRVYRDDGLSPDLIMVSDLLTPNDSLLVVYHDTISGLSGRRTYTYAATTESTSFVESVFSNKVYVRPQISESPGAPLTLNAYEEDRHVVLFWEDMQARDVGIAGYLLSRSEEPSLGNDSFISLLPEDEYLKHNNFTDRTVEPGKVYIYRVQSVDLDGNISQDAALATVALQTDRPVSPIALQAISMDEGIYLSWGRAIYDGLMHINVYRSERGSEPRMIATLPADTDEYTDEDVLPDTSYYYFLTTFNEAGVESEPSDEVGVERQ